MRICGSACACAVAEKDRILIQGRSRSSSEDLANCRWRQKTSKVNGGCQHHFSGSGERNGSKIQ
eukprot:292114-Pleurochrysis_carterae.AAC.1